MRSKYKLFTIVRGTLYTCVYYPHISGYVTRTVQTIIPPNEEGFYSLYSIIDKEIGVFK